MRRFYTLVAYEIRKIISYRIKALILIASALFLFCASAQRYVTDPEDRHVWQVEQFLDGRIMDESFFKELDGATDYGEWADNPWRFAELYTDTVFRHNESVSILYAINESDYRTADEFYTTRQRVIDEFADAFFLTKDETSFWKDKEASITKPFVYRSTTDIQMLRDTYQFTLTMTCMLIALFLSTSFAGESERQTDALVYTSKYGRTETLVAKLTAGCVFSLVMGCVMLLATHIPVVIFSGLRGLDAPWYMVMPFSGLSTEAWQMLLLHTLVLILGCILTGLLTMVLSLLFDKTMAASGTIFALILLDLFGDVPTSLRLLSQIRYLTPIAVLLNTNVPDMRLAKVFGTYLISFQVGPLLYMICGLILVVVTFKVFHRRYGGNNSKR